MSFLKITKYISVVNVTTNFELTFVLGRLCIMDHIFKAVLVQHLRHLRGSQMSVFLTVFVLLVRVYMRIMLILVHSTLLSLTNVAFSLFYLYYSSI